MTNIKHYVTFLSPGTFVSEMDTKEISSWDIEKAIDLAGDVLPRYGSVPYAFFFVTKKASEDGFKPPKKIAESGYYFLGGRIKTLEEVKTKNDPNDRILISNMEGNDIKKVIINTNSWTTTRPFDDKRDVVIPEADLVNFRAKLEAKKQKKK